MLQLWLKQVKNNIGNNWYYPLKLKKIKKRQADNRNLLGVFLFDSIDS